MQIVKGHIYDNILITDLIMWKTNKMFMKI